MDDKKRGVLQISREEDPREKETPVQGTGDRTKLVWFKGPKGGQSGWGNSWEEERDKRSEK